MYKKAKDSMVCIYRVAQWLSHPNDCPTFEAKKPEKAINDCKDEEGRCWWDDLRHVLRPAQ